jgi:hypothetical protein
MEQMVASAGVMLSKRPDKLLGLTIKDFVPTICKGESNGNKLRE